jgi:S1-C subfamily serine protease
MVLWARILVVAIIGIILGIGIGFSQPPEAVAPSEPVPAILTTSDTTSGPVPAATSTSEATTTAEIPAPPPAKKVVPEKPKEAIPLPPPTTPTPSEAIETAASVISTLQPTTTPQVPTLSEKVRQSLVNIVCITKSGGPLESISGSGVIIDSRGIILTNSHVAQFLLLKDYPTPGFMDCIVRTGSPAYPRYTVEPLFMPPSWMTDNAHKITEEKPLGNGEHDYALLRVTGTVGASVEMPASFPYLPISTDAPQESQSILVAGYPAGFLGGITVATNLYASSAEARVRDVYTFGTNTLDLFSVGGTIVDQQGSSGGPVTDMNGNLLGLIVTATDAADTASRDLRAISTSYIISDFAKEAGVSLQSFLAGDISAEAQSFNFGIAPTLRQELIEALESSRP